MQKRKIDAFDYANDIVKANPRGILLTTKAAGEVDTMVIGWGHIGNIWGEPTFVAYVRTSRRTHDLLEASGEFTVNVPEGKLRPDIFKVAGTQSGRNVDKVAELGLTLVDGENVGAPAILEAPLTLECRVIYKQLLDADAIPREVMERFYPADVTDIDAGANCYMHVAYYGEIVGSYVLEV